MLCFVWDLYYVVYFTRNMEVPSDRYLGIVGCCVRCFSCDLWVHASMAVETPLFFIYWNWISLVGMVYLNPT
jgi:hypothetical protein